MPAKVALLDTEKTHFVRIIIFTIAETQHGNQKVKETGRHSKNKPINHI